jgi:uncharacterized protein
MAIAIFPSLEGESLEDVGIRLAERWRIGHKDRNDGVILLVFVRDRQVRLEVGYGLEARVPDAVAGQIVREEIGPRFREGRYAEGLEAAARAVYRQVEEGGAGTRRPGAPALPVLGFFGLLVLIVALLAAEAMRTRGRRHYTLGPGGWAAPSGGSWRSGGGPWIGGGGWGGGGSGGGFSGGGGSFGGGGASGRW